MRDAGLIAAAQKVEHYEIASYGSVRTHAMRLGDRDVADTLQMTLDEEGQADKLLTQKEAGLDLLSTGDAMRYRKLALGWNVPYAMWFQTFHGEDRYRDPSESELRQNIFSAWTFGYKMITCFTFSSGSSCLFKKGTLEVRIITVMRHFGTFTCVLQVPFGT